MRKSIVLIIFLALGSSLFAQDDSVKFKGKVLLAYENTSFKKELIKAMDELLQKDSIFSTIIEHSKGALNQQNPSDFKAVFISNSGVNSKVRPWVSEWLKKNESYSKMIILHTTQTKDWKVEVSVDAVTSASKKKDTKKLAAEYVELIKNRLSSEL